MRKRLLLKLIIILLSIYPLNALALSKPILVKTYPIDQDMYHLIQMNKDQYAFAPDNMGTPFQIADNMDNQHILIPILNNGEVIQTRIVSKYWDDDEYSYHYSSFSSQLLCKELNSLDSPLFFCDIGSNTYAISNGTIYEAALYNYPHENGYQSSITEMEQSYTMVVDITKTSEEKYGFADNIATFWPITLNTEELEERAIKIGSDYYIPAAILSKYTDGVSLNWLTDTKTLIINMSAVEQKNQQVEQLALHIGQANYAQLSDGSKTTIDNVSTFLLDDKTYISLSVAEMLFHITIEEDALVFNK